MSISTAGLGQILFCDKGKLGTTNDNAFAIGLRGAGTQEITPFKGQKDYLGRALRNMMNHKYDVEGLTPTIKMLKALHSYLNMNADVQILTHAQPGGNPYCFKYTGNDDIGLGFEYSMTPDKRNMKILLERAFEYLVHTTFMDKADDPAQKVTVAGITGEGADFAKFYEPYFLKFEAPIGTALVNANEIVDRSLTIKTDGKKNAYNQDIVDYLLVTLSLTGRDATIAKILTYLNKDMAPSILWREGTTGAYYEEFNFAANTLTLSPEVKNADDDYYLKINFEGKIPVNSVQFCTGDTYGDEVDGTGIKGGTVKFGY